MGRRYSGGQDWDWIKDLEEDLEEAFGITFEGWREAAQKVGRWFRWVKERRRFSCGIGTRTRRRQRQNDTGRLQP